MKLLVVDDDLVFLKLVELKLGKIGYSDVTCCGSANEALATIRSSKTAFDCLLVDIKMPGMNGIALCRAIRQEADYAHVPILIVTSARERHYVNDAFKAGATDYLSKPLHTTELSARLRSMGQLAQSIREGRELSQHGAGGMPEFGFDDAILLENVAGLTSHLALENYLFKISFLHRFRMSLFGIHVGDARSYFATLRAPDFADLMADITDAIWYSMPASRIMFAYAGRGDFVVVSGRLPVDSIRHIEDSVNAHLGERTRIWSEFGIGPVRATVGKTVNPGLIPWASVPEYVERAIGMAYPDRGNTGTGMLRRLTGWGTSDRQRTDTADSFNKLSYPYDNEK
ncbi:MAG: PleD family two-component system response regulator [Jhaorihella sp.]